MQRVMRYLESQQATHGSFDLLQTGVAEFQNLIAVQADQMVVLSRAETLLVHCNIGAELVPFNKAAIQQQVECIIDRCSAHMVLPVFHLNEEGIHIEVVFVGINLVENGIPLGGLALFLPLQISGEDLADFQFYAIEFILFHQFFLKNKAQISLKEREYANGFENTINKFTIRFYGMVPE